MLRRTWMRLAVLLTVGLAVGCKSTGDKREGEEMTTENVTIVMETSKGTIEIELWGEKAPKTVANFLSYVDDGFFNGTIYHRVIPGFMIQGGGFTSDMRQKGTRSPVQNEADNGVANGRGTIAMARTMEPDSATAQFFINLVDNGFLNHTDKSTRGWGYCAFGKVTAGMDVVDAIAKVATGNQGPHQNVPTTPVVIESVRRK
jgi:peptidyl-prolyl cis-trans isomerase B (cyclophilin B)